MITNVDRAFDDIAPKRPETLADLHFELALWARGLENFCSIGRRAFPIPAKHASAERNYRNEFHIVNAVLNKCGELIEELGRRSALAEKPIEKDVRQLARTIRALVISNGAFARNQSLNFAEWNAWGEIVAERLIRCEIFQAFDKECEEAGRNYLPAQFKDLFDSPAISAVDRSDLGRFLPRLGGMLRSLEIVRRKLAADAPLKPALAIFAFLYEAINELVADINHRISQREDETSEMFGLLDATSYTLSIESKKVFSQELSAVIGTRPATAVFARIESAFGLLNDNIRQLLAGFLRLSEPGVNAIDLFPEFRTKLEQSVELRSDLWKILGIVRAAESEAGEEMLDQLKQELNLFLRTSVGFLFYKDRETFERFCNEIAVTQSGPDARPILHTFSAYVETLFSQVGMRAVLSNHPFKPE